jgi:hypothetical protein
MEKDSTIEGCPSCAGIGVIPRMQESASKLTHWPIQIKLMGTVIPFLPNADLLVAADCTAFSVPDFQTRFLEGKKLLIGCPKLDNAQFYVEKFTEIFSNIPVRSLTCLRMEVPCCGGMTAVLGEAIKRSGKAIPFKEIVIGVKGNVLKESVIYA